MTRSYCKAGYILCSVFKQFRKLIGEHCRVLLILSVQQYPFPRFVCQMKETVMSNLILFHLCHIELVPIHLVVLFMVLQWAPQGCAFVQLQPQVPLLRKYPTYWHLCTTMSNDWRAVACQRGCYLSFHCSNSNQVLYCMGRPIVRALFCQVPKSSIVCHLPDELCWPCS